MPPLSTLGVVTETAGEGHEWAALIARRGYVTVPTLLRAPLPPTRIDGWFVILSPRTLPNRVALWLRALTSRIVLVTPHLTAGQHLASWVPSLSMVCDPAYAREGLADILALLPSLSSGVITLTRQP